MAPAMVRTYRMYKVDGTNMHVLCALPINSVYMAVDMFKPHEWKLEGVYDASMVKNVMCTNREKAIDYMKGWGERERTRQANQSLDG